MISNSSCLFFLVFKKKENTNKKIVEMVVCSHLFFGRNNFHHAWFDILDTYIEVSTCFFPNIELPSIKISFHPCLTIIMPLISRMKLIIAASWILLLTQNYFWINQNFLILELMINPKQSSNSSKKTDCFVQFLRKCSQFCQSYFQFKTVLQLKPQEKVQVQIWTRNKAVHMQN